MTRRRPRCREPGEEGAATVLVLAFAGVLLLLGGALGVVAAMVVAHRTAQAAADLAAVAAAASLADGDDACSVAHAVAAANDAAVTACAFEGRDVLVSVRVDGPRWLGQRGDLAAQARAGPVSGYPP